MTQTQTQVTDTNQELYEGRRIVQRMERHSRLIEVSQLVLEYFWRHGVFLWVDELCLNIVVKHSSNQTETSREIIAWQLQVGKFRDLFDPMRWFLCLSLWIYLYGAN